MRTKTIKRSGKKRAKKAKKPVLGRPRKTKLITNKTRSITLDQELWKSLEIDAEESIRSINGQVEWIIREYYRSSRQMPVGDTILSEEEAEEIFSSNKK